MQLSTKASLKISDSTLHQLVLELRAECQNIAALTHQLQLENLSDRQKADILAELLAATIHLHAHCDEDLQNLIAQELENLTDVVDAEN